MSPRPAARAWSPWGAGAIAAPTVNDTPTTAVAPPTLEDLRVIRRWHLRDKCLRGWTTASCICVHGRPERRSSSLCVIALRTGRRVSSRTHATPADRTHMIPAPCTSALPGRDMSARAHGCACTPLDLYRESRRNAPRRPRAQGHQPPTRRKRLPTVVDAEIGCLLYDNMCVRRLALPSMAHA